MANFIEALLQQLNNQSILFSSTSFINRLLEQINSNNDLLSIELLVLLHCNNLITLNTYLVFLQNNNYLSHFVDQINNNNNTSNSYVNQLISIIVDEYLIYIPNNVTTDEKGTESTTITKQTPLHSCLLLIIQSFRYLWLLNLREQLIDDSVTLNLAYYKYINTITNKINNNTILHYFYTFELESLLNINNNSSIIGNPKNITINLGNIFIFLH